MLTIGIESAAFPGQSLEEIDRLLHMVRYPHLIPCNNTYCVVLTQVVVGGGPTGIELRFVCIHIFYVNSVSHDLQWRIT